MIPIALSIPSVGWRLWRRRQHRARLLHDPLEWAPVCRNARLTRRTHRGARPGSGTHQCRWCRFPLRAAKGPIKGERMVEKVQRINSRYLLNVVEDAPDFRDYEYRPALIQLNSEVPRPDNLNIRDQGREGDCTGFGLAAAIDLQLRLRGETDRTASTRMLYETAKQFDEWEGEGEDYHGSSCRGAVKGWHSMGVCSEELAPYRSAEEGWVLSVDQAKDARKTTLGAYYRVNKKISDYHAAINEVGAFTSAPWFTTAGSVGSSAAG